MFRIKESLHFSQYHQANFGKKLPSLEEIAQEWNSNVLIRKQELEGGNDFTYTNVILPNIKSILEKRVQYQNKIVDVGCGIGHLTDRVRKWGYNIQGFDIAQDAINAARHSYENIMFTESSIIDFSIKNKGGFDVCIVNMVLHNLLNLERNIDALNKLLKPGGLVIASIPNPPVWSFKRKLNLNHVADFGNAGIYKAIFKIRGGVKHPSRFTYVHRDVPTYNSVIEKTGFNIIESYKPISTSNEKDEDLLFCVWKK